jgi:putative peptidoglycan lipid II flippase
VTIEQEQRSPLVSDSIVSIKRSAVRFFSGTALSRVSGLLRDMILAFCFGTHEALAALMVAFRLSQVCRRLFGEGAMQSAFIPVFEELRKQSSEKAFRFFRDLAALMTLFLVFFISVSMIGLGASLYFAEWSPGNKEIVKLMILLMPSLLFVCLFGLNSSLLQCQKRYFTVGIAPMCFNIMIMIGSLLFRSYSPFEAMPYVALFIVLGCMCQWLVTLAPSWRSLKEELQSSLTKGICLFSQEVRRFGKPLMLGLVGVGASQINNAVDTIFARWADPQGPAQLWYALRLLQLPLALFGIAISGALLPPLSRSIQAGRQKEYLHFLNFALGRVFALLVPATLALYVLGTPFINCLYGRGDFQLDSILTTCRCLHGYALGLLPMGLIIVLAPAFYAYKDFKTPARAAFLSLFLNFILNSLFIFGFEMKTISVTLATSISSWVNVIYLYSRLYRQFGEVISYDGLGQLRRLFGICLLAGAATWTLQNLFFLPPTLFDWCMEYQKSLPTNFIEQAMSLAIPGIFFLLTLCFLSFAFKVEDLLVLFRIKKDIREFE